MIDALSLYYSEISKVGNVLILVDRADYTQGSANNNGVVNGLIVNTLHVKGLNDRGAGGGGLDQSNGFWFVARPQQSNNIPFYVTINNYTYSTFLADQNAYESFARDPQGNISFLKLGQLPSSGATQNRPSYRRIAYITQYFDTTLNKLLLWNGSQWVDTLGQSH